VIVLQKKVRREMQILQKMLLQRRLKGTKNLLKRKKHQLQLQIKQLKQQQLLKQHLVKKVQLMLLMRIQ